MKGALWQLYDELRAVLGRRYPEFVYGGPLRVGEEVPVFVFHRNDGADLEEKLRYLAENHYATISPDEYLAWCRGEAVLAPRAVLLTIDDGHASVRREWAPLLERYGMRATVFLVPGYMSECRSDSGLLAWEDVAEMHASGRFDFQSHTLHHHPVFQDPRPVGFYDPSRMTMPWDLPVPAGYEPHVRDGTIATHAGFPIYRSDSIFRSMRRYLDDEEVRLRMEEEVRRLGGSEYLAMDAAGSLGELKHIYREIARGCRGGRMQMESETRREIRENLEASRTEIESRIGVRIRHLCYPYSRVCPEVARMAREVGYEAQYLGVEPGRRTNRRGDDPTRTVRLKHDFLMTLPGAGRRTLRAVLAEKARRRVRGGRGV